MLQECMLRYLVALSLLFLPTHYDYLLLPLPHSLLSILSGKLTGKSLAVGVKEESVKSQTN